jgi:hypothetical protein
MRFCRFRASRASRHLRDFRREVAAEEAIVRGTLLVAFPQDAFRSRCENAKDPSRNNADKVRAPTSASYTERNKGRRGEEERTSAEPKSVTSHAVHKPQFLKSGI